jgi:hypothetical protein
MSLVGLAQPEPHKLAIGHLAASKRHHQGMLPLAIVLSDLDDLLPQPLRHPSMWLANQRDDTLKAGIANRAPAGNLNTLRRVTWVGRARPPLNTA